MTPLQKSVQEFMALGGYSLPEKPTEPDAAMRELCARLIFEEALETIQKGLGVRISSTAVFLHMNNCEFRADLPYNPVELADGGSDTNYVVAFAANAAGIDLEPVDTEVCRSNLTKFLWKEEELDAAVRAGFSVVKFKEHKPHVWYACVKNKNGKIQKPPGYSKADIKSIIEKQA